MKIARMAGALAALALASVAAPAADYGLVKVPPLGGWVLATDGTTLILSVTDKAQLVYVDTAAEKVLKTVDVDFKPTCLACRGDKLYACGKGTSSVFELERDTGKLTRTIKIPGDPNTAIACAPEKGPVFLSNASNVVSVIFPENGRAARTGARGMFLAADPEGKYLYTGTQGPIRDQLVIDGGRGRGPTRVSVRTTGERALLLKYEVSDKGLKLVATNDNAAINGKALGVSPDGKLVAMAGGGGWRSKTDPKANYSIAVFEAGDLNTQAGQVETGPFPTGIAFHPVLSLGVAEPGNGANVMLFNTKSFAEVAKFSTAKNEGPGVGGGPLLTFAAKGTKVAYYCGGTPSAAGLYLYPVPLKDEQKKELEKASKGK
jgi:DNA-binding beta-propeller fold protein YncE